MTELKIITDTGISDETIKKQVLMTMTRGLPELQPTGGDLGRIDLYANGPSAMDYGIYHPAAALNGALSLFGSHPGPEYWIACDPGPVVVDFLKWPLPRWTQYLVASKCSPDVFDALSGLNVKVWHVLDATKEVVRNKALVPSALSVTTTALFLLSWLGYSHIIVHGWDGCYGPSGESHAAKQEQDHEDDCLVEIDGHSFNTNLKWIAEMEDAANARPHISAKVEILGDGLMPFMLNPIFSTPA